VSKEEVERKALAQLIRRERAKQAIRVDLFDRQLGLHDDPSQFKATHAGRRSGKSTGMAPSACLHVMDAGFNEVVIIGAETQKKAKELHWASLQQLVVEKRLPLIANSSAGTFSTPWGAKIIFWGLNDAGAVELLRGYKIKAAYFDEVQTYAKFLPRLISTVLEPALGDTGGPCTLYGTPSVTRKGDWADICLGKTPGWSIHHWDVRQNKKFPRDAESMLQQILLRNKWTWDPTDMSKTNAIFAREWLGLFVNDPNSQVFRYDPDKHDRDALPTARTNGFCTLGIDYGTTDDPCAWVVIWSARGSREMYVLEAQEHYNLLPDDAAEVTKSFIDRWNPQRVVGDGGGLGAPYVKAFNRRYGHLSDRWVQPAEKQGRLGQIAIVSGEIDSGRVHCLPAARALADEWQVLPWKESKDGKDAHEEFESGFSDHMSDAARYAIMSHLTDVPEKPKAEPTPKEIEAAAKEARLAAARASKNEGFDI
jgi:hypothetical protein